MNDAEFLESAITWEAVNFPRSFIKANYKPFKIESLINNTYYHQLIHATKNLYNVHSTNQKDISLSIIPHVPASITFVDPKRDSGFLVIVPNFFKAKNTERPYFVIKKKYNRMVFEQYYKSFLEITDDSDGAPSGVSKIKSLIVNDESIKINDTTFIFTDKNKTKLKSIEFIH